MSEAKHTPGPWHQRDTPGYNDTAIFAGKTIVAMVRDGDHDGPLVAAAPDMLAALQKLKWVSVEKDNMEFACRTTCFVVDEINAAIAKAEGRQ